MSARTLTREGGSSFLVRFLEDNERLVVNRSRITCEGRVKVGEAYIVKWGRAASEISEAEILECGDYVDLIKKVGCLKKETVKRPQKAPPKKPLRRKRTPAEKKQAFKKLMSKKPAAKILTVQRPDGLSNKPQQPVVEPNKQEKRVCRAPSTTSTSASQEPATQATTFSTDDVQKPVSQAPPIIPTSHQLATQFTNSVQVSDSQTQPSTCVLASQPLSTISQPPVGRTLTVPPYLQPIHQGVNNEAAPFTSTWTDFPLTSSTANLPTSESSSWMSMLSDDDDVYDDVLSPAPRARRQLFKNEGSALDLQSSNVNNNRLFTALDVKLDSVDRNLELMCRQLTVVNERLSYLMQLVCRNRPVSVNGAGLRQPLGHK